MSIGELGQGALEHLVALIVIVGKPGQGQGMAGREHRHGMCHRTFVDVDTLGTGCAGS